MFVYVNLVIRLVFYQLFLVTVCVAMHMHLNNVMRNLNLSSALVSSVWRVSCSDIFADMLTAVRCMLSKLVSPFWRTVDVDGEDILSGSTGKMQPQCKHMHLI